MGSVSLVSSSSAQVWGAAGDLVIPAPADVLPGDILVCFLNHRIGWRSWSGIPTGFVYVTEVHMSSNEGLHVYWKLATGVEPATYDWTLNISHSQFGQAGGIVAIRGANGSTPIFDFDTEATANGLIATVTVPAGGLSFAGLGSRDGGTVIVQPAPWNLTENVTTSPGIRVLDTDASPAGGETDWAGYDSNATVSILPAGGAAPNILRSQWRARARRHRAAGPVS